MRYKEYNPNSVLEKCILLFWQNGYGSCSINDIVSATGVNRFSLYEEFENKEGILDAALALYKSRYSDEKLHILEANLPVRESLEKFNMAFFKEKEKHPPGCFIIHIATEMADSNENVRSFLDNYISEIEGLLVQLLENDMNFKPRSKFLARQLLGLFCTAMSFCLIHTEKHRIAYISNGIDLILKETNNDA